MIVDAGTVDAGAHAAATGGDGEGGPVVNDRRRYRFHAASASPWANWPVDAGAGRPSLPRDYGLNSARARGRSLCAG
jgi:hypothetical protein